MLKHTQIKTKIFADGANKNNMLELYSDETIKGFTTNPTLIKQAGVTDYTAFCKDILTTINDKPVSIEVFSDNFDEMLKQAVIINSWGKNIYVKIPITNTKGHSSSELIGELMKEKIKVNVTAIFTMKQVETVLRNLKSDVPAYISIFAGRIADTGIDPIPTMQSALKSMEQFPLSELIWASPRELLNVVQANQIGCHIITATPDIIKKLKYLNYDLDAFSLDTVKMFYDDSVAAKFTI